MFQLLSIYVSEEPAVSVFMVRRKLFYPEDEGIRSLQVVGIPQPNCTESHHNVNSHRRETLKSRRLRVFEKMVLGTLFGPKRH
jgi:hypothetical protein